MLLQVKNPDEEAVLAGALTAVRWVVVVCQPFENLNQLAAYWKAQVAVVEELGVMQLSSRKVNSMSVVALADDEDDARRLVGLGADFVIVRPLDIESPLQTGGIDRSAFEPDAGPRH